MAADLSGVPNQIGLSNSGVGVLNGTNSITLSTPQNIHSGASPTFAGLTLNDNAAIGTTINNAYCLLISGSITAGTAQWGMAVNPTISSAGTGDSGSIYAQCTTAAAAFTANKLRAIAIASPTLGSGSSVTTNYGVQIGSASFACTSTTNYGLNIASVTGGTNNYAIYTNTGLVQFGDTVITTAPSTARAGLRLPSGSAPTTPTAGDLWYDGTNLKFRDGGTTRTLSWT